MSILDRLFGNRSERTAQPVKTQDEIRAECPHTTLMARWDSVDDMGKDDKATAFVCDSCHMQFTPEEGRHLRETTAERLHAEDIERARLKIEEAERKARE